MQHLKNLTNITIGISAIHYTIFSDKFLCEHWQLQVPLMTIAMIIIIYFNN